MVAKVTVVTIPRSVTPGKERLKSCFESLPACPLPGLLAADAAAKRFERVAIEAWRRWPVAAVL
jgi:hypothetical protein